MKKKWNYRTSICKFQSNKIITKLRYFDHTLVFVVHLYLLIFLVIPVLLFIFILMVIVTCICFRCKSCLFVCTMSVAKFVSLQIHWFMLKLSRLLAGWGYSKTWRKKNYKKLIHLEFIRVNEPSVCTLKCEFAGIKVVWQFGFCLIRSIDDNW